MQRADRVYAVSLDSRGKHMAVGGRDKMCALYDMEPAVDDTEDEEPPPQAGGAASPESSGPKLSLKLAGRMTAVASRFKALKRVKPKLLWEARASSHPCPTLVPTLSHPDPELLWQASARPYPPPTTARDRRATTGNRPATRLQASASDFIYAVALSSDLRHCCFSGMARVVHVVDGFTGAPRYTYSLGGAVWALDIVGENLAIGGEFGRITIFDMGTRSDKMHLLVTDQVTDVCLTEASLYLAHGHQVTGLGKSAPEYAWHEHPSFELCAGMMMASRGSEEQMVRCPRLTLRCLPTAVRPPRDCRATAT